MTRDPPRWDSGTQFLKLPEAGRCKRAVKLSGLQISVPHNDDDDDDDGDIHLPDYFLWARLCAFHNPGGRGSPTSFPPPHK